MKKNETDIFELANNISKEEFRDFLENHGTEFRGNMGFCPFHEHNHKTPSLGIFTKDGKVLFKCQACSAAGDIAKYAALYFKTSNYEGATKVLDYLGILHNFKKQEESEEEKAKFEEEAKQRRTESQKRRERYQKQEKRLHDFFQSKATEQAPILAENFYTKKGELHELLHATFPNQSPTFEDYAHSYLGYDFEHQSLCILIRDDKKVYNIKHHQKFIQDKKTKTLSSKRMDGKWIGFPRLSGHPFPLEYFRDNPDEKVIICEGEKDALNLLSYGINVLTLGGVHNSWDTLGYLLKNKIAHIWFDNDNAGYEASILRYLELKDKVKDIFIIPFFSIAGTLPNKYDISDFLKDKNFTNAEDIWNAIAFSSFKLNATIIEDMEEYTGLNLSQYLPLQKPKDFRDIKKELLKKDENNYYVNVFTCKGELDDEYTNHIIKKVRNLKRDGNETLDTIIQSIAKHLLLEKDEKLKEGSDIVEAIYNFLDVKKTLLTNYRQTHIVDFVLAFIKMCNKAGHPLAEYQQGLHIWTGTHYLRADDGFLSKFIISQWMKAAKVDFKKQLEKNVNELIKNLLMRSRSLDEIKEYETRRIMTCLNGTLFISPKGKVTFTNFHDAKNAVTNLLKFEYNKEAKAPKWERFLNRVLPNKDDQKTIMEFLGYCFLPNHDYEAFLFLYGPSGANGKSVILDVFQSFLGDENVSALQLGQLHGHELHGLANKLLNIGSELQKDGLDKGQLATLKNLVSPKDKLQINPKNKDPYVLLPRYKPKSIMAGNVLFKQNMDPAVFRRMLLIIFDIEIKDNEKVRGLSDRFNDELSGIFNLALEGLSRLIRQGTFTKSDKMREKLNEYKDEVNPLRAFVRDALEANEHYRVPKTYLYLLYKTYISAKGNKPLNNSNFFKGIKAEFENKEVAIEEKQTKFPEPPPGLNERPRCIDGIKVKESFEISAIDIGGAALKIKDMNFAKNTTLPLEDIDE